MELRAKELNEWMIYLRWAGDVEQSFHVDRTTILFLQFFSGISKNIKASFVQMGLNEGQLLELATLKVLHKNRTAGAFRSKRQLERDGVYIYEHVFLCFFFSKQKIR